MRRLFDDHPAAPVLLACFGLWVFLAVIVWSGASADAAAATVAPTERAVAARTCADRDALVSALATHAGRRLTATARTGAQTLEIMVAPDGAWTILVDDAAGMACVVAAGDAWRDVR